MQTPESAMPNGVPTVQRPEHKVAAHIRDAADTTGVPFEFLLAQANQESRLNPNAKSTRSSAMGLFQFTAGTWMEMVKKHGAEHGLDKYADAITRGSDGRWAVKDKDLKKEILDLRRDPKLSALMAGEYAKDNEQVLESKLGRQVSPHDLYLAHFLGAGGALKVLKGRNQPDTDQAPPELAGAARANPELFQDPASGEQRSLGSVYTAVNARFRRAMADAAQVAHNLRPQVDLAALKPETRPESQPETDTLAAIAAPTAGPGMALTMADIPATVTSYPARLPPRPSHGPGTPVSERGEHYPVALPPPVAGARADADTLRGLMSMMEDKG
ncbi:MAG: transglycosylase SLT domain-containing protein [Rhodospirillaceae bacterium]|nr:transglycosylase SLT domain-containing protein [Rhodospirillales bacterium]